MVREGPGYAPLVKLSAAPADELLAPLARGLRGDRSLVVGTNCRDYSAAASVSVCRLLLNFSYDQNMTLFGDL